jgi:hypothetical protein
MPVRLVIPLVFVRIEVDLADLVRVRLRLRRARSVLPPGQALAPGRFLRSPDGIWTLAMQQDGNVVLGHRDAGPKWASGTDGFPGGLFRRGTFVVTWAC